METPFKVPDGTASKLAYLIVMEEDTWLHYTDAQREECKLYWENEAYTCRDGPRGIDVRIACLQLIPDFLFPSTDKTTPYVAWQQRIFRDGEHEHIWKDGVVTVQFVDGDGLELGRGKYCTVCGQRHP